MKRDTIRKGIAFRRLAIKILGEVITAEATLKIKNLNEVTDCGNSARRRWPTLLANVRLRKGSAGTPVDLVHLPEADANKFVN